MLDLLAVLILAFPLDLPSWLAGSEGLRAAIQDAAIAVEIMDQRERPYLLARPEAFEIDLGTMRRRRRDLWDAPPACDAERFPHRERANELLALNRAYRTHLDVRHAGEQARYWQLHALYTEVDRLYYLWDLLRDSRCEYYYITVRRHALKRLRGQIGEEAYYDGRMPPPVPVHWFQRVD